MSENIFKFEKRVEKNPNERELLKKLETILGARDFEEFGRVEDERGLCSWSIKTLDEVGDRLDIIYERSKILEDGTEVPSKIHQALYMGDIQCSAGDQYNFVDGNWEGPF